MSVFQGIVESDPSEISHLLMPEATETSNNIIIEADAFVRTCGCSEFRRFLSANA
jgi:hypothetical protein